MSGKSLFLININFDMLHINKNHYYQSTSLYFITHTHTQKNQKTKFNLKIYTDSNHDTIKLEIN